MQILKLSFLLTYSQIFYIFQSIVTYAGCSFSGWAKAVTSVLRGKMIFFTYAGYSFIRWASSLYLPVTTFQ